MCFVENLSVLYDSIKVGFENLDEDTAARGCQHLTGSWLVAINWSIVDVGLWAEIRQEWNNGKLHIKTFSQSALDPGILNREDVHPEGTASTCEEKTEDKTKEQNHIMWEQVFYYSSHFDLSQQEKHRFN